MKARSDRQRDCDRAEKEKKGFQDRYVLHGQALSHLTLINYNLSIPLILVPDRENSALYKHNRPGSSTTSLHTTLVFSLRMCFSEHTC